MGDMKPQELAALLKVTGTTLRRWALEFNEFLSPNAQRGETQHRAYDARDIQVLAWIATLRLQNEPLENIHALLKASQAHDWSDLPPLPKGVEHDEPVAMMPVDTAIAKLDALTRERDELLARLAKSESENARLRDRADGLTDMVMDLNNRLMTLLEKDRKTKK